MRKDAILIGGIIGLAAYGYYKNVTDFAHKVQVKITGIKLNRSATAEANYLSLFFDLGIRITNPTNATVIMRSADVDLSVNGKYITNVQKTEPVNIYPNGVVTTTLAIKLPTLKIFTLTAEAIKVITLKQPVYIGIKGMLDFVTGKLQLNEKVKAEW